MLIGTLADKHIHRLSIEIRYPLLIRTEIKMKIREKIYSISERRMHKRTPFGYCQFECLVDHVISIQTSESFGHDIENTE